MSDQDYPADRQELADLCLSFLKPPTFPGGSWTLNPTALADAIYESDWLADQRDQARGVSAEALLDALIALPDDFPDFFYHPEDATPDQHVAMRAKNLVTLRQVLATGKCQATVTVGGRTAVCVMATGHDGPHDEFGVGRTPMQWFDPQAYDQRPHSRACGWQGHPHGDQCAVDCPTCHA